MAPILVALLTVSPGICRPTQSDGYLSGLKQFFVDQVIVKTEGRPTGPAPLQNDLDSILRDQLKQLRVPFADWKKGEEDKLPPEQTMKQPRILESVDLKEASDGSYCYSERLEVSEWAHVDRTKRPIMTPIFVRESFGIATPRSLATLLTAAVERHAAEFAKAYFAAQDGGG